MGGTPLVLVWGVWDMGGSCGVSLDHVTSLATRVVASHWTRALGHVMYIPSAEMGSYDSWKPPPQKMSSKQLLEAKYGGGGGSLERQGSRSKMTG